METLEAMDLLSKIKTTNSEATNRQLLIEVMNTIRYNQQETFSARDYLRKHYTEGN